jgi:acyl-lipid omega-6 desaturase (Delta-12 desaturase)
MFVVCAVASLFFWKYSMAMETGKAQDALTIHSLREQLSSFAKADRRKALLQLATTFVPYGILWALLVFMVHHTYPPAAITPFILITSLFLVRIFILFHDCVHGSFFASQRANRILGYISGIVTFTPFTYWQSNHLVHHGTYADLDHRGVGDIWTLTVAEYTAASKKEQLSYRLYRNPLVFLGIGPGYTFLLTQRLLHQWNGKQERFSVVMVNLAIAVILWAASLTIGLGTYLVIQLPILLIAGAVGVWLFYVQHQFEGVYWSRHADWEPVTAALKGCSHYKLPGLLQWFTASIGLHHVHHVLPRIPNYRLQQCYDASPVLQSVKPLNIRGSIRSLFLNLWDEDKQQLVNFKQAGF